MTEDEQKEPHLEAIRSRLWIIAHEPEYRFVKRNAIRFLKAAGVQKVRELPLDRIIRMETIVNKLIDLALKDKPKMPAHFTHKDRELLNLIVGTAIAKIDPKKTEMGIPVNREGKVEYTFTPSLGLVEDLGLDSFDMIELTIDLEDELQMPINEDEVSKLKTFGELTDYLWAKDGQRDE